MPRDIDAEIIRTVSFSLRFDLSIVHFEQKHLSRDLELACALTCWSAAAISSQMIVDEDMVAYRSSRDSGRPGHTVSPHT